MNVKQAKEQATATEVEGVLRHFTQTGQLAFKAYMEGRGLLDFKLCQKWEILGVTVQKGELSFMASAQGTCMKFALPSEKAAQKALEWFKEASARIQLKQKVVTLVATIPPEIVISAGVTEHQVPLLKHAAAA